MGLLRDRTALEQEAIEYATSHNGLSCEASTKRLTDSYTSNIHTMTISELPSQVHGEPNTSHDNINNPPHYNKSEAKCSCGRRIECIDVTRHLNFNIGNAMKYLWRCDLKNAPIDDLRKAIWYIKDEIAQRVKHG